MRQNAKPAEEDRGRSRWGVPVGASSSLGLCLALAYAISINTSARSRIPTPESVVGFAPGAEYKLATYDQTIEYFKELDAASDT